jgi:hypothetical protein
MKQEFKGKISAIAKTGGFKLAGVDRWFNGIDEVKKSVLTDFHR